MRLIARIIQELEKRQLRCSVCGKWMTMVQFLHIETGEENPAEEDAFDPFSYLNYTSKKGVRCTNCDNKIFL